MQLEHFKHIVAQEGCTFRDLLNRLNVVQTLETSYNNRDL